MKLILTEDDLSTITNALCAARDSCKETAKTCEGAKKEAFERSAEQYGELCEKIDSADTIEVQL